MSLVSGMETTKGTKMHERKVIREDQGQGYLLWILLVMDDFEIRRRKKPRKHGGPLNSLRRMDADRWFPVLIV